MGSKKHGLQIIDSDAHFTVDPITRNITNDESTKNTILQGDHNSERFTFKIPRYIDGHDMSTCDNVRVAYINTEVSGRDRKHGTGVYLVSDLAIDPSNNDYVTCSWLISKNATMYTGILNFMLIFSCMDGELVKYRWKTNVFESINVALSLDADLIFEAEYLDVIEQWKDSVKNEFSVYLEESATQHYGEFKDILHEEMAAEFDVMQEDLDEKFKTKSDSLDEQIDGFDAILRTEITNMDGEIDTLKSRMNTFSSLKEGSTTGDAELADIRVGADGVTYDTAGAAVRGQMDNVHAKLDNDCVRRIVGKNKYNKNDPTILDGTYYAYDNASIHTNEDYECITIPIDGGTNYHINAKYTHICFYNDANVVQSNFISGLHNVYQFTSPSNAVAMIVSYSKSYRDTLQIEEGSVETAYESYQYGVQSSDINDGAVTESKLSTVVKSRIKDGKYICNITIDINGTGDFTSIRQCFDYINDVTEDYDEYLIDILPGVYDIRKDFTDDEWNANGFVGLYVPDKANIRGRNKNDVFLTCTSENGSDLISMLNFKNNVKMSNITLQGSALRYVIHDDFSDFDYANEHGNVREIENVDFIGSEMYKGAVYGAGTKGGSRWHFKRCRFMESSNEVAFTLHDKATSPASILKETFLFDECEFVGNGAFNVRLCPAIGGVDQNVTFTHCKFGGILISSQYTSEYPTTVYNIQGSGNTKRYETKYYREWDAKSFPRFSDDTSCRFNKGTEDIMVGDYVILDDKKRFVKTLDENVAYGVALENIPVDSCGYVRVI